MRRRPLSLLGSTLSILLLCAPSSCQPSQAAGEEAPPFTSTAGDAEQRDATAAPNDEDAITVEVNPLPGQHARGTITLSPVENGVAISGVIHGLRPSSRHGLHVHEHGDCSHPEGKSAGEHYAPEGNPHGPPSPHSHAGDLGNITADNNGTAAFSIIVPGDYLAAEGPSFRGRSIIVHERADDLHSQPSGASGARIGCGIIPQ